MWNERFFCLKYTAFSLKSPRLAGNHSPPLMIMSIAVYYFSRNHLERLEVIFLARSFWLSVIPRWQMGQFSRNANQISTVRGRLNADTGNLHLIIVLGARNNSTDKINVKRQQFWVQNLILQNHITVAALGSQFWRNWQSWLHNRMILQLSVLFKMPAFYHTSTMLPSSFPQHQICLPFIKQKLCAWKQGSNFKTQQSRPLQLRFAFSHWEKKQLCG